jgi:hypothetical protein
MAVVTAVSEYDSHIGRLIKAMYAECPEMLHGSEKSIAVSDLVGFERVDDAIASVVDKEVETVLRKSHIEQLVWLEKKLSCTLTEGLSSWGAFVELTQRRNLFVHADGMVSAHYLAVCRKHGAVQPDDLKVGMQLDASVEYVRQVLDTLAEVAVKLNQVMWRRLKKEQREQADESLNELIVELIGEDRFSLAERLAAFGLSIRDRERDPLVLLFMKLNLSQAILWQGDEKRARKALRGEKWKLMDTRFQFAHAVIFRDFVRANKIFPSIPEELLEPTEYMHFPLFRELRQNQEFQQAFRERFGIDPQSKTTGLKEMAHRLVEVLRASESRDSLSGIFDQFAGGVKGAGD